MSPDRSGLDSRKIWGWGVGRLDFGDSVTVGRDRHTLLLEILGREADCPPRRRTHRAGAPTCGGGLWRPFSRPHGFPVGPSLWAPQLHGSCNAT